MSKEDEKRGVRITDQFRQRDAMMYDLKCDQMRITISIAAESNPSENWNVGAVAKVIPTPRSLNAIGPSKGEALDALGLAWSDQVTAGGFPVLDWKAIRDALALVRAI